jgi:predicted ATP-grasp superfamily ATP-dependent carboligase
MTHLRADALRRGRLRVLITGVSTRAAADSAARAGFDVTSLDGYADRDQHPAVRALALPRDLGLGFSAGHAAAAAASIECDAVAYLSNFENDPSAVAALAATRTLWGNPPDVLRRVRDPFTVAATFRAHGLTVPRLANDSDVTNDSNDSNDWLLKPFSSGGGHGIRPWRGTPVPKGCYLQERIEGRPGSIVFVAANGRAMPLGISRQLIGDHRFGATGARYCGSILATRTDPQFERGADLMSAAHQLAAVAAAEFRLVGVNGIDFIERSGVPYPIEINPRWSASMELIERSLGVGVFAVHAASCTRGDLPASPGTPDRAVGKAIVFARDPCVAGDTDAWLRDADIRDVPHLGDPIAAGSPDCTVFAEGADAAACEAALVERARRIYEVMRRWIVRIHDSQFAIHDSNE